MKISTIPVAYYQFVDVLCKDGDKIIASLTADRAHLMHMVFGLIGEVNEVDEVLRETDTESVPQSEYIARLTDELGDVLFYTVGCANVTGIGCAATQTAQLNGLWEDLYASTAAFAEYVKKLVMYGREWDEPAIQRHILNVYACIEAMGKRQGITIDDMIATNKRKLNARYEGEYTDAKANNKRDKQPNGSTDNRVC